MHLRGENSPRLRRKRLQRMERARCQALSAARETAFAQRERLGPNPGGTYQRARRIIWQGVDRVLRWLWYPAHLGRAILHQVRQADCPERSLVISWSGARWRGGGRF